MMQPPSILRTDNQPANLSDLLGLPAAPYFDSHICHVSSLITALTYVTISYFIS